MMDLVKISQLNKIITTKNHTKELTAKSKTNKQVLITKDVILNSSRLLHLFTGALLPTESINTAL